MLDGEKSRLLILQFYLAFQVRRPFSLIKVDGSFGHDGGGNENGSFGPESQSDGIARPRIEVYLPPVHIQSNDAMTYRLFEYVDEHLEDPSFEVFNDSDHQLMRKRPHGLGPFQTQGDGSHFQRFRQDRQSPRSAGTFEKDHGHAFFFKEEECFYPNFDWRTNIHPRTICLFLVPKTGSPFQKLFGQRINLERRNQGGNGDFDHHRLLGFQRLPQHPAQLFRVSFQAFGTE